MNQLCSMMLAVLILGSVCACGTEPSETVSTDTKASGETASAAEDEPVITRENYPDTLPELDFGQASVAIHTRGDANSSAEVWSEAMTGESVNDAVYERNRMVEERLNVRIQAKIVETWDNYNQAISSLRGSIMSGDGAYDIVAGWSARIPSLSLEGLFLNINELPHVNLEQPWWNQAAVKELQIGNKLYFLTGNIANTMLSSMCVYVFNQKLASDLDIENLYDVVNQHKWTMDYVHQLVSKVGADLNGDGKMGEGDLFGLTTSSVNDADGYLQGFYVSFVSRDDKGLPRLDLDTEKMSAIVEKVYNLNWDNKGTSAYDGDGTDLGPFAADRALLSTTRIDNVVYSLVDMKSDYGILPYPLFDESQEKYGTRVQDGLSLWCLPLDVKNAEMSSAVLEAMAAQSYRTVTPAYFDLALKYRYSRDKETSDMMDLIESSIYINFESLYNESIGYPWFVLRDLMPQKNKNFASYWEKKEKQVDKSLSKAVEKIEALE